MNTDDLVKIRTAGYEWGLRGNDGFVNSRAHKLVGVSLPNLEECPETCEVCNAFAAGLRDGLTVFEKDDNPIII